MCAECDAHRLRRDRGPTLPAGWVLPADPCAVCVAFADPGAERVPHTCAVTLTRPAAVADGVAYPVAFTRTLRDA